MKNYIKFIAGSALTLVAFSACSKLNELPTFEESESYVSFAKSSYSITEDGGQIILPVSLAAYGSENEKNLPKTNVSYKILSVDTEGSEYTAKENEDFKDTSETGVLIFDGSTLTQNIVIDIIDRTGEYTGDLTFAVELATASNNLKISAENLASITITDNDHPLASILGDYTVKTSSYFGGDVEFTVTLEKDPSDVKTVWVTNILDCGKKFMAMVTRDEADEINGFVFPSGQKITYNASYLAWLVGFGDGGYYYPEVNLSFARIPGDNVQFKFDAEKVGCDGIGGLAIKVSDQSIAGWLDAFMGDYIMTKK